MRNPAAMKRVLSTIILCTGLSLASHSVQATVADGVYAYEKGNYQQARMEWLPYAALGNPNALYNLGQLSRMGRGIEKNYNKAEEYYLRAAEKGHVGAQRNLGTLYYFGRLGEIDHSKARNWLLKAAVNGDAKSQLMTGTMYYNGEAGEKNTLKAYAWIKLSSQSGLRNAAIALDKLSAVMTEEQIAQAKALIPNMISRQLSPDDVGLMVQQQDNTDPAMTALNTEQAVQDSQKKSVPEKNTEVRSSTKSADIFRVQLGSFRTKESAQKAFDSLNSKLSDILADTQTKIEYADLGEKGIFYRLQLLPFETSADAKALCSQLKENGQNCYVMKRR
ncbi:MAG: SEL1-like repeat protein [Emcibacter sp.]|nr:SEL1-like repeat protein [Emcibacter sp.]